jgi:hypothetical protein
MLQIADTMVTKMRNIFENLDEDRSIVIDPIVAISKIETERT